MCVTETCRAGDIVQQAASFVERHRFDIERTEYSFLVYETTIFDVGLASRQDDTHRTEIHLHCAQVGTVQGRTLHVASTPVNRLINIQLLKLNYLYH